MGRGFGGRVRRSQPGLMGCMGPWGGPYIERLNLGGGPMQSKNKIFDDLSQLMTNAMGVAQGAKDEAQNAMKGLMDRWLADRDFVTREEFEAVRAMAQKAREENEVLKARLDAM